MPKSPTDDEAQDRGVDSTRRKTPTYVETVRSSTPRENDLDMNAKNRSSRTRIGLPPVTILPGQIRREGGAGSNPDAGNAAGSGGGSGSIVPADNARVVSRETMLMGAAPRQDPAAAKPHAMVVSAVRIEGAALQQMVPQPQNPPRGRKSRPAVPAAEVASAKHTVPGDRDWRLAVLDRKLMPQAAAIRSMRHRLADKGDPRVIMVTSANRREGKTFCAANLALSLAEVRRSRVLLLEANVYHPTIASLFGITQFTCFLDQLDSHKRDFMAPWQVVELSAHDLHVLAIDRHSEKVRPLEGSAVINSLDSLRGTYDYIIVDGPSVSSGPEVPLLEDGVDGLIFTSRTDRARAKTLKHAIDQISMNDLLGVVLLDI